MVSLFMGKYKHQPPYTALEFITKLKKKDSVPKFTVNNQLFTLITLKKIHHTMFPKFFFQLAINFCHYLEVLLDTSRVCAFRDDHNVSLHAVA
jgi:hypothetical protein